MTSWSKDITNRLIELASRYTSTTEIIDILSKEYTVCFSKDAINSKLRMLRNVGAFTELSDKPKTVLMPYYEKYRGIYESDAEVHKVTEVPPNYAIRRVRPRTQILYLGDLHIPFEVEEQVQMAVNQNRNADICITAEVSDFYSISRFNKNFSIPLEVEIDRIIRYYEFLSNTFPITYVIQANHDNRVGRQFTDLPSALAMLVKTSNMLKYLSKPFNNIVVVDQWYIEINDAIFAHAESFSTVDMKVGVKISDWMREWTATLGLNPFSCLVQGHVHQMGVSYRPGVKIFEAGCLCYQPDYSVERIYSRPQANGYVEIVQENGVTNFELTREHRFDTPVYKQRYNPVGI